MDHLPLKLLSRFIWSFLIQVNNSAWQAIFNSSVWSSQIAWGIRQLSLSFVCPACQADANSPLFRSLRSVFLTSLWWLPPLASCFATQAPRKIGRFSVLKLQSFLETMLWFSFVFLAISFFQWLISQLR